MRKSVVENTPVGGKSEPLRSNGQVMVLIEF